jgi:hypothetical protein
MTRSALTAIVAVVAVAALGLLMRRGVGSMPGAAAPGAAPPPPPPSDPDETSADEDSPEIVALTSDGWSFLPVGDRDKLRLVPPRVPEEMAELTGRQSIEQLGRGDLIAARVTRGAPDHDPWRLEALGRDHEYRAWRFETEEAARAALALVEGRVVQPPRDRDGERVAVDDADFMAARRREEEIEAELATMSEPDEGAGEPRGEPIG